MNWVDRQTRAIFIEFSVYNPNINLIMVSTILVEFLSSGSILMQARFDPLNLFNDVESLFSFKIIALIILMAFIVYYMIIEIIQFISMGFVEYWKQFWSWIEWSIIVTAWISFILFLIRLQRAQEVLDWFKTTRGFYFYFFFRLNSLGNSFLS